MTNPNKSRFWEAISYFILKGRIWALLLVTAATAFFASQLKSVEFTFSEANLLPNNHPINLEYEQFLKKFGEEGNVMVIGVKDPALFEPKTFRAWNALNRALLSRPEFEAVISTENLQELHNNAQGRYFELRRLLDRFPDDAQGYNDFKDYVTSRMPFYEQLIYNKEKTTFRSILFLDKKILNTSVRKDFILEQLIPLVKNFEKETGLQVHISGMPYIRTMSTELIKKEIPLFVVGALLATSIIFFLFFRSVRAMSISLVVVLISVVWGMGLMGLLHYKITILTALIPPLIIVIGIPNCIFIINRYQQEVSKTGDRLNALGIVITRIGNATLMTNLTTAAGFGTFMITDSQLMKEFGLVASLSVLFIFVLSLIIIPGLYSFMPVPKKRHLKHLDRRWMKKIIQKIEQVVKHHRIAVYISALSVVILGIIGAYQIKISGSLLDDIPKDVNFSKDIKFFEDEFGGVLPVEITINTNRRNGATSLSTLRKMDKLQELVIELPDLSTPLSLVNVAKYVKQSYYNGNPKFYELPSTQESSFILPYLKKSANKSNNLLFLKGFIDSTQQTARISTMMKDVSINRINHMEEDIKRLIDKEFPSDKFETHITGKALAFTKGTRYLVGNLFISLLFAIGLIALLMAFLFRSFRMIAISLITNIIPLITTAGIMGFFGIPLKPSTILVFSIAFGISVDNTLHFLAKYRQELIIHNRKISKSVYSALRETGISMFYTSVVLLFGFSVFILSDFGGTVALGSLISITLFFAMLSNLVLLPSLLVSLEKTIAKKALKASSLDIISYEDDDNEQPTDTTTKS